MRQRKWISVVALVAALLNIGARLNHDARMAGLSPQLAGLLGDVSVLCSAGSAIAPASPSDQRQPGRPMEQSHCLVCTGGAAPGLRRAPEPFLRGAPPAATPSRPGWARASDGLAATRPPVRGPPAAH